MLNHIESGVVAVNSGSRITRRGPKSGFWKLCFRCVLSFVPPAKLEYSPADRDVGILMIGTLEPFMVFSFSFPLFLSVVSVPRPSNVVTSLASA